MASSKGRTPNERSAEELSAQLAELQLENKRLRKRLQHSDMAGRGETVLTPAQRDSLVVAAAAKLTTLAGRKIEGKIKAATAKAMTRQEFEETMMSLSMRIDLSMGELSQRAPNPRRSRASSKPRGD